VSKLLVAFVHHDDADRVTEALRGAGQRFTHLPSVGGFLGAKNSTFLLAVEEGSVESALEVFERSTGRREVEMPLVLLERLQDWREQTVSYGGATILVLELERIVKL
jgi:uncharacterized protein YaaQ